MPTSPSCLPLHRSGELKRRARLAECQSCPRKCRVNRLEDESGTCRTRRQEYQKAIADAQAAGLRRFA